MKRSTPFYPLARCAVGALVLLGAGSAFAAGRPLFVGDAAPQAQAQQAIAGIAARPATADLRVLRADADAVSAKVREIEIDLGTRRITLAQSRTQALASGSLVWSGKVLETAKARPLTASEVRDDQLNSAILVRRGDGVTGTLRVDGQLWRIRPLADGNHALVQVDESLMPADHPDEFRLLPTIDMAQRGRVGTAAVAPAAVETIRVQAVATSEAVSAYGGDMRALVELAVAETNQGYANSGVEINMELAHYRTVNYNDVGHSTDLARFRSTSDGYFDDIHATRDQYGADVNVLVINDGGYCGLASGIGSSASTAFATVYWDCATGYYSFGHEVGHLQSARHDPANDPSTTPYAYGHGYQYPSGGWRTIMAYACSGGCARLNYWSNPNRTYNGVPMGTASQSHNQRVLENTKATVAAFRGGGTTPPPTGQTYTNGTDYAINDNATVESPIAVSGRSGNAGTSVPVAVNIVHTYRGDLKVDLVAPDGSVYVLHNRSGGSADNINSTYTVNLSSEALNGTWRLRVNDNANQDTGYINSWSITF
jgi:peptidyl-Asp metalloendopeptidase